MRLGRVRVYWTPWWDVDHHAYGCPIEVIVHTRRWVLMVRPFSNFAQGGDRRGELEWLRTREGPSPYEREKVAKWELSDQRPETWDRLENRHDCRCRYCVWCLNDEHTCRMIGGHTGRDDRIALPKRYVRHGVFVRHLWSYHVRMGGRCGLSRKVGEWVEVGLDDKRV